MIKIIPYWQSPGIEPEQLKKEMHRWAYLGTDSMNCNELKRRFGSETFLSETQDLFQGTLERLLPKINELTAGLSKIHLSLDWWITDVSEKGPYNTRLMHDIAFLFIFDQMVKKQPASANTFFLLNLLDCLKR